MTEKVIRNFLRKMEFFSIKGHSKETLVRNSFFRSQTLRQVSAHDVTAHEFKWVHHSTLYSSTLSLRGVVLEKNRGTPQEVGKSA